MEDHYHQRPYHGLHTQSYASRSMSSMSESNGQRSLDNTPPMQHYQASMAMTDPLALWQHMPSRQSDAAAMSMMGTSQQNNAAALIMLQSQGLSYYPSPVKMFSPTMQQQSQNAQFYHASLASSKRFSEEEKQKLEKVFTDETQKPSTSRKRQLAEDLGCPVPKVNNWFQNRRAREKQMHRVQAYEASQAADRAASGHDRPDALVDEDDEDAEDDDAIDSDPGIMGSRNQILHLSTTVVSETDTSSPGQEGPTPDSSNGYGNDSVTGSPVASPLGIIKVEDEYHEAQGALVTGHQRSSHPQLPLLDMSPSDSAFNNQQDMLSSSPEPFEVSQHGSSFQTLQHQFASGYASLGDMSGLGVFIGDERHTDFYPTTATFMTQRTPTITTSIAEHEEEMEGHHDDAISYSEYDSLSPHIIPHTSPTMDQTDLHAQDSPHTSIASRRKIRPPQRLNQTALRDFQNGPKTGIEDTKRTDMFKNMRRAASANGPLSGKIFKSAPPISPRSPRIFGPNFLEQLSRHSSLSAAAGQFKDGSSGSPVGPSVEQRYLSAGTSGLGLQHRSSSLSLNSSAEKMSLSPGTSEYTREASSLNRAHNLGLLHFQTSKFAHDMGCGNISPDEPLATPSLSQFGSELDFSTSLSAPRYVESEPTTPSYVPVTMAASAAAHHGYPVLKIEPTPQANSFPWSRSPDHFSLWNGPPLNHFEEPQSQTFQFQPNVTPSNFQSPTSI